jgi:hypothetical protein
MILTRKLLPAAAAIYMVFCAAPGVFAQAGASPEHPNFSGRWRMIKDKSDFAHAAVPDIVVRVIDQRGSTLNVHTIQTTGTTTKTADVSYFIDGSPSTNVINNHPATSKTFWDGAALNVRTTLKLSNGDEELIEDRWELSDDGNTLTTTSHVSTPKGGTILKLVCEKEKT